MQRAQQSCPKAAPMRVGLIVLLRESRAPSAMRGVRPFSSAATGRCCQPACHQARGWAEHLAYRLVRRGRQHKCEPASRPGSRHPLPSPWARRPFESASGSAVIKPAGADTPRSSAIPSSCPRRMHPRGSSQDDRRPPPHVPPNRAVGKGECDRRADQRHAYRRARREPGRYASTVRRNAAAMRRRIRRAMSPAGGDDLVAGALAIATCALSSRPAGWLVALRPSVRRDGQLENRGTGFHSSAPAGCNVGAEEARVRDLAADQHPRLPDDAVADRTPRPSAGHAGRRGCRHDRPRTETVTTNRARRQGGVAAVAEARPSRRTQRR